MKPSADRVILYTDGGCDPNPGAGGWAAILTYKGHYKELSGAEHKTTNNRMELLAAIKGLEALKQRCAVTIYTDSEYLKNGITAWLPGWKRHGWKRRGGALKNVDLWQQLDALTQEHDVHWQWIPGHAGNLLNERCDALAQEARAKLDKK